MNVTFADNGVCGQRKMGATMKGQSFTADELHRAARTVCELSGDAGEARLVLGLLGLEVTR